MTDFDIAELEEEFSDYRPDDEYQEMSFNDYMEEVTTEHPEWARSAHQRVADMFEFHGTEYDDQMGIRFYKMFRDDPLNEGENEFYGVETHRGIHELVNQIKKGAMHGQAEKRLKLSVGPVSSGKSDVDATIRKYFEDYTRREEGAMYTFKWENLTDVIEDQNPNHDEEVSRLNQDPLVLIPQGIRDKYLEQINEAFDGEYTIKNDQEMDPTSRFYMEELLQEYDGNLSDVLDNHVQVIRMTADENAGQAVSTFEPKDPKNQDEADITGGVDMSKLASYGEGDPRAFDYKRGALGRANRGIASGEELMRLDDAHLNTFLSVTEEGKMETQGAMARVDLDLVLLGRTNMPWLRERWDDEKMKAFNSRTRKVDFSYNLEYGEEKKIYEKFLNNSDFDVHLEPHTLELAGLFAVLTRLEEPSKDSQSEIDNILDKAKVYNGEDVEGANIDFEKLMTEAEEKLGEKEGMSGLGVRPMIDQIEEAIQNNAFEGKDYLNPDVMLDYFEENLSEYGSIEEDLKNDLGAIVGMVNDEYHQLAREDLRNALAYDPDEVQDQAEKYLRHAQADVLDEPVEDDIQGKMEPDEQFMQSIEKQLQQSRGTRKEFRKTISHWYGKQSRRKDAVDLTENERLRRAIENKLWNDKKRNINFSGLLISGQDRIEDESKNEWIESLKGMGYSRQGAEDLIQDVGVQLAKEELEEA